MRRAILAIATVCAIALNLGAVDAQESTPVPQPPNVGGTAWEHLKEGKPGEISVISRNTYEDYGTTHVALVARNNTDETLFFISAKVSIKAADGKLFAASNDFMLAPGKVAPGEVAFGTADFFDTEVPDGATIEVKLDEDSFGEDMYDFRPDLTVVSAELVDDRIVGVARNDNDDPVSYAGINGMCFVGGKLDHSFNGTATSNELGSGESVDFQADYAISPCETFLIAVG